ncbi:hypothetical protein [Enterococcus sp. AZ192]|uniref:hypothetical protein n=1 Tax=unclassified Enterococcus TaxID=2608891 RepID=UPI003D2E43CE
MFKEWIKLAASIQDNTDKINELKCPTCGHCEIDYIYVGDLSDRIGYEQVWCNHCLRGIHVSRVMIPENVKVMSFEETKKINTIVPNFKPITPDE